MNDAYVMVRLCGSAPRFCCRICCWRPGNQSLHNSSMTTSTSSATQVEQPPPAPAPASAPPPAADPQRTAEARAAFTAHLTSIGNTHISSLEARVSDIHNNSSAISKQEGDVVKQTKKLAIEAKKHQKVADDAAEKLKELGDIQNWAEVLERDLLVIEETIKMGEAGEDGWETEDDEVEGGGDMAKARMVNEQGKGTQKINASEGHDLQ